ncbi:tetratricopeptide repeat protein [Providencia rettgeri]|uniref:tetratricopeptide repeat protein n=1 Tax=Providencia rettgeri TaxID=587 RepID=UPI0015EB41D1|nr:tetratricopeptide repeat protein [Providencia rettgeri]QLR03494.1 sel1 repeat family protein [Providencia rettgeri]
MLKKLLGFLGFTSRNIPSFNELMLKAKSGDLDAQYEIGTLYDVGEGVEENEEKAIEWYLKAASQGHSQAQYMMGMMYETSEHLSDDSHLSLEWFQKSAAQGNSNALGHLEAIGHSIDNKK